jgi:hypothetical protein
MRPGDCRNTVNIFLKIDSQDLASKLADEVFFLTSQPGTDGNETSQQQAHSDKPPGCLT